ncbi:MAG: GDSL-type esterase/lipase family protein [Faecalibacterium sp.]|nr:GDSL-type esterase/lipase family protein [Ruminococcus sp.]MCM1392662.1 GDSL-type esterase/lipase family protein [Ruminococcus sp.]MCM1486313.1 GDSL-type esterase/lipase family protein [Faecalibacterium sp.]
MKYKKSAIIFLSVAAVVLIIAALVVNSLYSSGNLRFVHNLKDAKDGQIKVACVGDSVTYGMNMESWGQNAYPVVLQSLLGNGYCVNNYGYSGRTVQTNGNKPYINEKIYQKSLDFAPDIVVLQIGSNDSKSCNWQDRQSFADDYAALAQSYINLPSNPKVFIVTPPPAFEVDGEVKYDIHKDIIQDEIYPAVMQVANDSGLQVIDLNSLLSGKSDMFVDGLHPNPQGAQIFAKAVADAIK